MQSTAVHEKLLAEADGQGMTCSEADLLCPI